MPKRKSRKARSKAGRVTLDVLDAADTLASVADDLGGGILRSRINVRNVTPHARKLVHAIEKVSRHFEATSDGAGARKLSVLVGAGLLDKATEKRIKATMNKSRSTPAKAFHHSLVRKGQAMEKLIAPADLSSETASAAIRAALMRSFKVPMTASGAMPVTFGMPAILEDAPRMRLSETGRKWRGHPVIAFSHTSIVGRYEASSAVVGDKIINLPLDLKGLVGEIIAAISSSFEFVKWKSVVLILAPDAATSAAGMYGIWYDPVVDSTVYDSSVMGVRQVWNHGYNKSTPAYMPTSLEVTPIPGPMDGWFFTDLSGLKNENVPGKFVGVIEDPPPDGAGFIAALSFDVEMCSVETPDSRLVGFSAKFYGATACTATLPLGTDSTLRSGDASLAMGSTLPVINVSTATSSILRTPLTNCQQRLFVSVHYIGGTLSAATLTVDRGFVAIATACIANSGATQMTCTWRITLQETWGVDPVQDPGLCNMTFLVTGATVDSATVRLFQSAPVPEIVVRSAGAAAAVEDYKISRLEEKIRQLEMRAIAPISYRPDPSESGSYVSVAGEPTPRGWFQGTAPIKPADAYPRR